MRAHVFPPAEAPTPAERAQLTRWGERLSEHGSRVLRRFVGVESSWRGGEAVVRPWAEAVAEDHWAVQVNVGGALPLTMLLAASLTEALAAAALGVPTSSPPASLGSVDRAVLTVMGRELGQAARQALEQDGPALIEVAFGHERQAEEDPHALVLPLVATVAGFSHRALVRAPWSACRAALRRGVAVAEEVLEARLVEQAVVEVEAMLPGTQLTADELLSLRPGDVIRLGPGAPEVVLRVNGEAWGRGRAGARGNHLAVSLRQTASPESEADHGD